MTKKQPMDWSSFSSGTKLDHCGLKSEWRLTHVEISNAGYCFGNSWSRREREKQNDS